MVLFGTLYFSAFALGQLLFQFINLAFPDPLWQDIRFTAITGAIRWSISSLVVSTPVFLFVARSNSRKVEALPVKRASPVRRWLTYLTLAVTAPVFLFVARSNSRKVEALPVKRASPVRRWLTYLTLAVTASILIGDCTTLVYSLLGGEMTMRFFLKAATIGAIAGTGFVYYLSDLRRDERELGT